MEFLGFLFFGICILIVLLKPENERFAYGAFLLGTIICFGMFFIASWASLLPYGAY
ncbi:hypothetical protein [Campylobacter mucosalis]|uniref:Putative membrane protein n=1 Tax=Campylobacter mucosalis CCUG 21559 TaxID=1032067 RepID=A0A6G5QFW0_9BACT|nr:hypothetical protein [Campylobacter mucosalis]QCD44504.1 putative membrane protein [Campylobacter mucosalis CCUG 21559]QKF62470.1 putative membrane protein [Campylobacter mucosalis]